MTEILISYETALLAKEKRFDIKTTSVYYHNSILFENGTLVDFLNPINQYQLFDLRKSKNPEISNPFVYAPTQSLLQKFLREKHDIHILTVSCNSGKYDYGVSKEAGFTGIYKKEYIYNTYEEALELALFESLNLIKL